MTPRFTTNQATTQDMIEHFIACDTAFTPLLSSRVTIPDYCVKLARYATRFEAWSDQILVGLVAAYYTAPLDDMAFVSNVSVMPAYTGHHIGQSLMMSCIDHASALGFSRVSLEVDAEAHHARFLYQKLGFQYDPLDGSPSLRMVFDLPSATDQRG